MKFGRTIQIYLENGNTSGIRHLEIVNWSGQGIFVPRTKIKDLDRWAEAKRPGIYFLFGRDEKNGCQAVYIGESENILERLRKHINKKEFWNEAIFFTSKDDHLTKSHIKYLEARSIEIAKDAGRYTLENSNRATLPSLPLSAKDSMEEFILNIKILLGSTGHKVLEPLLSVTQKNEPMNKDDVIFTLTISGISAKAILNEEGMVVLKDSQAKIESQTSLSNGYKRKKEQLIDERTLTLDSSSSHYIFSSDCLFTSPSQAAAVITGIAINGRSNWKIGDMTLEKFEKIKLKGQDDS